MTYFGVLGAFLLPPLFLLLLVVPRDVWRRWFRGTGEVDWRPYWAVLAHVVIAVLYTSLWDNYLVATNVWWYDESLVSGVTLGWVPIEEYLFFVLQTLLTGLWVVWLWRRQASRSRSFTPHPRLRIGGSILAAAIWLASMAAWLSGWSPGTYLALILAWALPPVLLQLAFGADILRFHGRLLAQAIVVPTAYLWLVDALAISSGTWTIDPLQTTGINLGVLPLEEMTFFLMTNTMLSFGIVLLLSDQSRRRAETWLRRFRRGSTAPA